jgi:hypothetical protein
MKNRSKPVSRNAARALTRQQQQFVDGILSGLTPAQAAQAAGYCRGTGRTYSPAKAASAVMSKPHIKAALGRAAMAKATEGGGQLSEQWLRDQLVAGAAHGLRESQVACLSMLCRWFFKDKTGAADPADDPRSQPLSDADVNKRIAELLQEVGYAKPADANESTKIASRTVSDVSEHRQPTADAPERRQQTPEQALAALEDKRPSLNMPVLEHNERWSECPQHGAYVSVFNRAGHWSFCGKCVKAWQDNERYLASLMPMGPGK